MRLITRRLWVRILDTWMVIFHIVLFFVKLYSLNEKMKKVQVGPFKRFWLFWLLITCKVHFKLKPRYSDDEDQTAWNLPCDWPGFESREPHLCFFMTLFRPLLVFELWNWTEKTKFGQDLGKVFKINTFGVIPFYSSNLNFLWRRSIERSRRVTRFDFSF